MKELLKEMPERQGLVYMKYMTDCLKNMENYRQQTIVIAVNLADKNEGGKMEWINVKDGPPKIGQRFLGMHFDDYTIDHYKRTGENEYFNLNWCNYEGRGFIGGVISHWMPEPPKPEKS
jgi:hypothetical protein